MWSAAQPLVIPALGMAAGIALDGVWHWPIGILLGVFVAAGCLLLWRGSGDGRRWLAILLAAGSVGALLHDTALRRWPADHVVRYCGDGGVGVRLTGTAITTPLIRKAASGAVEWYAQQPRSRFEVQAERVAGIDRDLPVSGTITVSVREPVLHVSAGDQVELFGIMYRPGGPMNPGELDFGLVNQRRGVLVQVSCDNAASVRLVELGRGGRTWWSALRRRLNTAMLDQAYRGSEPGAQLLSAMVLGQRSAVSRKVNDAFVATGTVHYLSVSGAHIAMLAGVVWLCATSVGLSQRACAMWTIGIVTSYAVLVEPSAPVWRSMIVGNLLCIRILVHRPTRSLNWLAFAAIVLLAIQPTQLFDPGFQLSFGTVIAILYLYPRLRRSAVGLSNWLLRRDDPLLMPRIQDMLNPPSRLRRVVRFSGRAISDALLVSVAAWLGSALPTAYHFQRLAMWGWFDTVIALPLIWLTQMLGFLKAGLSVLVPPLGGLLGPALALSGDALIDAVMWLSGIPASTLTTPAIPGWLVIAGTGMLLLWVVAERLRVSRHTVAVATLGLVLVGVYRLAPAGPSGTLRLRVLAVGNASAQLLTFPNGRTLVCDLGSSPLYDLVQWTGGPVLGRDRIAWIDAAIVSHPNLDHYSAIPDLAERRSLGQLIVSPYFKEAGPSAGGAAKLLGRMKELCVPVRTMACGGRLEGTGEAEVDVLWPPAREWQSNGDPNDASIVLRIGWAGRRILLCGDIGQEPQMALMSSADLKADVLVLPHHGKIEATTPAFIAAVDPRICIRSSGRHDDDRPGGLRTLAAGRMYFNTAEVGAVRVDLAVGGVRAYQGARDNFAVFVEPH